MAGPTGSNLRIAAAVQQIGGSTMSQPQITGAHLATAQLAGSQLAGSQLAGPHQASQQAAPPRSGSSPAPGVPIRLGLDLAPLGSLAVALAIDAWADLQSAWARARASAATRRALISCAVGGHPKRLFDIVVAATALVVLSPVMLIVAVLIKLSLGGPVLYSHPRVGQTGRSFDCLKFRSMVVNGDEVLERHLAANPEAAREWQLTRKLRDDPRITSLGHILRKSSLDELPQFINVLRGDMSCVGPRPIVAAELAKYGADAPYYLSTRPGLTGIWQVSGRNSLSYEERVGLDTYYVRNWSFWLDLRIMLLTIPAVLKFETTC